jgi:ribosomal protein S18 acetylase RimI-like enzyme
MSLLPVTVRNATDADAVLLAEVGARTFSDTFAADNSPEDMAAYLATAFGPALQAAELADPSATFLIAEADGEAAGYAKLQLGDAPACVTGGKPIELVRLYAERKYLGRGVGAALMQACLLAAKRSGARTLWLGVWEHNHRAQTFYRKWGFTEVGSHEFRLGADIQTDILMVKEL